MTIINRYSPENAPDKSKDLLQSKRDQYGFDINIFADMAESPLPIKLYTFGQDMANAEATLSKEEINLVQLATSVENACKFCVPAHSTLARQGLKTDDAIVDAIREGRDGPNEKYNALVTFTRLMTAKRGHVEQSDLKNFLDAGYTKEHIFEVLTIIAYKVITNYTSAIAGTEPNEQFAAEAWSPENVSKAA